MSLLKLSVILLIGAMFSKIHNAAEGVMLTISLTKSYPKLGSNAELECVINGFWVTPNETYHLFFDYSNGGIRNMFGFIKQNDEECMGYDTERGTSDCGEGTNDPHTDTKVYHLTIKNLTRDLAVAGWTCSSKQIGGTSNLLFIKLYKFTLTTTAGKFINFQAHVTLECSVTPAEDFQGTVIFYLQKTKMGAAMQSSDGKCRANSLINYTPKCADGTSSAGSKVKKYLMLIRSMEPKDYKTWYCHTNAFNVTSNVLRLQRRLCRIRKCKKGFSIVENNICTCSKCPGYFVGSKCEKCGLSCENEGTVNATCKFCECPDHFTGDTCDKQIHRYQFMQMSGLSGSVIALLVIMSVVVVVAVPAVWLVLRRRPDENEGKQMLHNPKQTESLVIFEISDQTPVEDSVTPT